MSNTEVTDSAQEPESFVADYEVLKENHKTDDLIDVSLIAKDFKSKIVKSQPQSLIGLVGPFGSGKSTLLHQISRDIKHDKWIEFDAWKFPDRGELWEGFVLEFARNIDENAYKAAKKLIEGKQNDDKKALVDTLSGLPFPGASAIKGFNHFFATSPARRTIEIQEILSVLLEKRCKGQDIFIVVEDIDRSGDAGIFFLETLKYFLGTVGDLVNIKVLVPIAEKNYIKYEDSFLKCLTIVEFLPTHKIQLAKFVKRIIKPELLENNAATQMAEYLQELMKLPDMTLRKIKLMLRKADLNYLNQQVDGHQPDWRMSVMFETAKHMKNGDEWYSNYFRNHQNVPGGTIFAALMQAIATNRTLIGRDGLMHSNKHFKLIPRQASVEQHPSTPWVLNNRFPGDTEHTHYCCDFYLDY